MDSDLLNMLVGMEVDNDTKPDVNPHDLLLMSLVSWYDSIPFHFRVFSISALTLTYYDAWNRCDASRNHVHTGEP